MFETRKGATESLQKYQTFFDDVYAEGVLNRKTKHLIALGASLAAGCQPSTQYCLAVARELGATDEELKEAMAVAMAVGATKIRLLQESTLVSMGSPPGGENRGPEQQDQGLTQASCIT
jgi:AhpD family alkylhydroperoxidase